MLVRGAGAGACAWPASRRRRVDLAGHDPVARAALADADGLARVLVAPSTPLGIEALPAGEAEPLLAAYHEGVAALGGAISRLGRGRPRRARSRRRWPGCSTGVRRGLRSRRRARRPGRLRPPRPGARDARAPRRPAADPPRAGAVAPAVRPPPGGRRSNDYARRCRRRGTRSPSGAGPRTPGCASASRCSPASRRCTASGCWLAAAKSRATPVSSSTSRPTGSAPIDAVLREIGVDQLVYGSDRPVVAPHALPLGDAVLAALRERNPLAPARRQDHGDGRMNRDLDRRELTDLVAAHRRRPGAVAGPRPPRQHAGAPLRAAAGATATSTSG